MNEQPEPVKNKGRPKGSKNKVNKGKGTYKRKENPKIVNMVERDGELVNAGGRPKGAPDVLPRGSMSVSRRIDILKSIAEDPKASGAERVASIRLISDILNDKLQNPIDKNGMHEFVVSFQFPQNTPHVINNNEIGEIGENNDKTSELHSEQTSKTTSVRSIQNESLELDDNLENAEVFKHQVLMKDEYSDEKVLAGENSLSPSSPKKVDEVSEIFADDKNDGDISVQFLFDEDNW